MALEESGYGASATVRGFGIQRGSLWWGRKGCWSCEVRAATDELEAGAADLELFGTKFSGFIPRKGGYNAAAPVLIVGCRGGLLGLVPPRSYARGIKLREVLADLLSAIDEELSDAGSDVAVLNTPLRGWMRRGGSADSALTLLVDAVPPRGSDGARAIWRTDREGRVVVRFDGFDLSTADEAPLTEAAPIVDAETWAADDLSIEPGTTYGGRHVNEVRYVFTATALRAHIFYEDLDTPETRTREAFYRLARETFPEMPYRARVWAEVRSYNEDEGTADVHFDDPHFEDMTVRIAVPSPGAKLEPPTGRRALVTFPAADPSVPFIDGWESDGKNAKPVVRKGDRVHCGWLMETKANAGVAGALVVVSVQWFPPNTKPAPISIPPLVTVTELIGENFEGSKIFGVE